MDIEKIERMTDAIVKLSNVVDSRSGSNFYNLHAAINAIADKIKNETLVPDFTVSGDNKFTLPST